MGFWKKPVMRPVHYGRKGLYLSIGEELYMLFIDCLHNIFNFQFLNL